MGGCGTALPLCRTSRGEGGGLCDLPVSPVVDMLRFLHRDGNGVALHLGGFLPIFLVGDLADIFMLTGFGILGDSVLRAGCAGDGLILAVFVLLEPLILDIAVIGVRVGHGDAHGRRVVTCGNLPLLQVVRVGSRRVADNWRFGGVCTVVAAGVAGGVLLVVIVVLAVGFLRRSVGGVAGSRAGTLVPVGAVVVTPVRGPHVLMLQRGNFDGDGEVGSILRTSVFLAAGLILGGFDLRAGGPEIFVVQCGQGIGLLVLGIFRTLPLGRTGVGEGGFLCDFPLSPLVDMLRFIRFLHCDLNRVALHLGGFLVLLLVGDLTDILVLAGFGVLGNGILRVGCAGDGLILAVFILLIPLILDIAVIRVRLGHGDAHCGRTITCGNLALLQAVRVGSGRLADNRRLGSIRTVIAAGVACSVLIAVIDVRSVGFPFRFVGGVAGSRTGTLVPVVAVVGTPVSGPHVYVTGSGHRHCNLIRGPCRGFFPVLGVGHVTAVHMLSGVGAFGYGEVRAGCAVNRFKLAVCILLVPLIGKRIAVGGGVGHGHGQFGVLRAQLVGGDFLVINIGNHGFFGDCLLCPFGFKGHIAQDIAVLEVPLLFRSFAGVQVSRIIGDIPALYGPAVFRSHLRLGQLSAGVNLFLRNLRPVPVHVIGDGKEVGGNHRRFLTLCGGIYGHFRPVIVLAARAGDGHLTAFRQGGGAVGFHFCGALVHRDFGSVGVRDGRAIGHRDVAVHINLALAARGVRVYSDGGAVRIGGRFHRGAAGQFDHVLAVLLVNHIHAVGSGRRINRHFGLAVAVPVDGDFTVVVLNDGAVVQVNLVAGVQRRYGVLFPHSNKHHVAGGHGNLFSPACGIGGAGLEQLEPVPPRKGKAGAGTRLGNRKLRPLQDPLLLFGCSVGAVDKGRIIPGLGRFLDAGDLFQRFDGLRLLLPADAGEDPFSCRRLGGLFGDSTNPDVVFLLRVRRAAAVPDADTPVLVIIALPVAGEVVAQSGGLHIHILLTNGAVIHHRAGCGTGRGILSLCGLTLHGVLRQVEPFAAPAAFMPVACLVNRPVAAGLVS